MFTFFNKLSFTKKLIVINALVILPVLVIGTVASIYFITINEKLALQEQVGAISSLTASYSVADLIFNDKKSAEETLKNLEIFPSIAHAYLLNTRDDIVATYGDEIENNIDGLFTNKTVRYTEGQLLYYNPIVYKSNDLGTLVLVSNTVRLQNVLRNLYIGVIVGSLFSFLLLLFMSVRLQSLITKPILKLVSTIKNVSQTGNYRTRIDDSNSNDEIGILYKGFNQMMGTIDKTTVSKNYLDSVMDALAEMLIVLDDNGKILTINEAVTQITEYELDDLYEKSPYLLIGNHLADKLTDGEIIETSLHTRSGKEVFVSVSVTSFIAHEGDKRMILSIRNVSKQKEAEAAINEYYKELERTNKELEKLSYITSHDLKAPLRGIASLAIMMKQDINQEGSSSEEIETYFHLMEKRIKRMDGLINGILEYSRVGRGNITESPIDLNGLIEEIAETVVPKEFEFSAATDLPTIKFNQVQIYQLFQNLISNAVKYNDKPVGSITVSWKDVGKSYQFTVKDNGPGIEPKYHSKVFEVFQMLHARDKIESTGIGLSIVKKIIDQCDGQIWIESETGKGVAFIFELPKK